MKTLLTITRADDKRNVSSLPEDTFTVMINPEQVQHQQQLLYDKSRTHGQKRQENKFSAVGKDQVSFEIVLDATGVVRQDVEDESITVQLRKLRRIIYELDDQTPQPNHVRLLWGTFLFFGQLSHMSTSFTLFKPSGEPLRAKLSFSFQGSVRDSKKEVQANANGDNAVQMRQVRKGDTLPLLCSSVYGDPAYYADVAAYNGLDQIEPLVEGAQLAFPARA